MAVRVTRDQHVTILTIDRPERRNAVDYATAQALADALRAFDADPDARVCVLTGAGGTFCAGADLKAIADGEPNRLEPDGDGPMGASRLWISKPTIAAIEGHAVAGGLELATWCDLRVMAQDAVLGVFCRRWGVPLIDGGTVRLPRLIGMGRALDLILTGRAVYADEALAIGLVSRIAQPGCALDDALTLARQLAQLPQVCMRGDRESAYRQWALSEREALALEFAIGQRALDAETVAGATRFASGAGRHGAPDEPR